MRSVRNVLRRFRSFTEERMFIVTDPIFDVRDFEKNRLFGALGYVAFFVPLFARPASRFGRFCANQGLLLWIAAAAVLLAFGVLNLLLGWIPLLGWLIRFARGVALLIVFAAALYYGYKAYKGKPERLPYVGGVELLR